MTRGELEDKLREINSPADSYAFAQAVSDIGADSGPDDAPLYLEILGELQQNPDARRNLDFYFAAYESLAYFYKRYDHVEELKRLVETYGRPWFGSYALTEEPLSWYYRRMNRQRDALQKDKELMSRVAPAQNLSPFISYVSSVCSLLEELANGKNSPDRESETVIQTEFQNALEKINQVIQIYETNNEGKHYGKHYALKGRLLLYRPGLDLLSAEEIHQKLDEANQYLILAIRYEDESRGDYLKRITEYLQYQNRLEMQRMLLDNRKQLDAVNETEERFRLELEHRKAQEMELLTIFTAVISFILVGGNMAAQMTAAGAVLMFCALTFALLILLSILHIMLYAAEEDRIRKPAIITAAVSGALLIGLLIFSLCFGGVSL